MYLLEGAFSYVHSLDDPMKFPKQPGKSYPLDEGQIPAETLEGLCRTLLMAMPLLKEDPNLKINNISLADYYRHQLRKLIDSTSSSPRGKNGWLDSTLVEFGALSISLFFIPDILWEPLTQKQKDGLAATMLSYGDGPTFPNNWKFFNIFVLSFYKSRGYKVNEGLLEEYLQQSLAHYTGSGWYDDNPAYDYYSMWAFQMYGMLWSEVFGKKYYPEYAAKFLANFKEVKNNYPYMFSRNGEMIMWGRSISYRMGAIIPFPMMGFENDPTTNYGWMRRISSGVILQFLQNPDLLEDNIPTLGFYGPFEPAVQSYSCRGSVFWMGKAFLGLLLPENNLFWTTEENEGPWGKELQKGSVYNKFQTGPNILITDYPGIGAAEIRSWCHVPVAEEPFRGSENYNRLSYNSAFPWQADSSNGTVAMSYVFKNAKDEWEPLRLYDFIKFEDGIYYRDAVLETNKNIRLNLADIPLPNGILRIDRNLSTDPVELRLGHYALPVVNGSIKRQTRKVNGHEIQIMDNGVYQLAMAPLTGWDKMETIHSKGSNPLSEESEVINVASRFSPDAKKTVTYATLMLWKKSGEPWSDEELMPVDKIEYDAIQNTVIRFSKEKSKHISFSN